MTGAPRIRVVIVDDVPEARDNVQKLLQFAGDVQVIGQGGTGREAIERVYETYFAAFPDFKLEQEMLLIDGDTAAQMVRVTGTDNGGFMGMAPTRRKITFRCGFFYTVRDGRITHERRVYDFTGLLIQVGLLKAKPV